MQRFFFFFFLLTLMGNSVVSANRVANSNNNLTVNIHGLKNRTGQVCLSLFSSSRGFPNDGSRALEARCINLKEATPVITFQNLRLGSYAVAVFHDFNNDGIFNVNGIGIPKEGFGFSRNPKIFMGVPKFEDAVVIIASSKNNIQIELKYF